MDSKLDFPKEFWDMPGSSISAKISHMLRIIDSQHHEIRTLSSDLEYLRSTTGLVKELFKRCHDDGYGKYSVDVVEPTVNPCLPTNTEKITDYIPVRKWHIEIYTGEDNK